MREGSIAVDRVAGWAKRYLISRRGFVAAVTGEELEELRFARVRWRVRSRRVVERTVPTTSRTRRLDLPAEPSGVDPWEVSSEDLAARTRRIVPCPACNGEKRVTCRTCGGSTAIGCDECGGRGRVFSHRSRRMVSCRRCRGTGARRCHCRSGRVACETCGGRGRVEAWLEIVEERSAQVRTTAVNLLALSLPDRGQAYETSAADLPVAPVLSWSGPSPDAATGEVAAILARPELRATLDPARERLEAVDVQVFAGRVATVSYRLFGLRGEAPVGLWDGRVRPSAEGRAPLQRRLWVLGVAAALALATGLAAALGYAARHPFYAASAVTPLLLLGAVLAPLALVLPLARLAPPRDRRSRTGIWAAMSVPVVLAVAEAVAMLAGRPSVAHARELAAAGRVEAARFEAAACADLGIDLPEASRLHDQLQLDVATKTTEPESAWRAARGPFYTDPARTRAEEHAVALTVASGEALLERNDLEGVERLLTIVAERPDPEAALRDLRSRLHLARFRRCPPTNQLACMARELEAAAAQGLREDELTPLREAGEISVRPIVTALWREIQSRGPTAKRLEACGAIDEPLQFLDAVTTSAATLPASREQVATQCAALRRLRDEEVERERRASALRAERAARAAAQRRDAALRSWARAPLLCRDGTLSPSCVCGQSSKRGCCSHHGGVAGCSQ